MNGSVWDICNHPPRHARAAAELYRLSATIHQPTPFGFFLDLIGRNAGHPITTMAAAPERLGPPEIGRLADALKEYAKHPAEVCRFVDEIITAEAHG